MKFQINPNSLVPQPIIQKLLRPTNRSKKYKNISQEVRNEVINKLTKENYSLKEVSDEYCLKPSTIKAIIKVYQEQGRIGKKSTRERKIRIMNTVVLALTDNQGNITPFTLTDYVMSDIIMDPKNPQISEITLEDTSLKQSLVILRQLLQQRNQHIIPQLHNQQALNNFLNQCIFMEQNPSEYIQQMKQSTVDQITLQNMVLSDEEKQVADQIYEVLKSQALCQQKQEYQKIE